MKYPRSTNINGEYGELAREALALGTQIGRLSALEVPEIPRGLSTRILRGLVRTRQAQVDALRLDVPFEADERADTIEDRIWEALPDILVDKGLVVGAVIQKNCGQKPELPHRITKGFEPDGTTITLKPVEENSRAHGYDAIPIAIHATVIEAADSPE